MMEHVTSKNHKLNLKLKAKTGSCRGRCEVLLVLIKMTESRTQAQKDEIMRRVTNVLSEKVVRAFLRSLGCSVDPQELSAII